VNDEQRYLACVALASNFRIGVEYTTFPTVSRALVWHGKRPQDLTEKTAGIVFPVNSDFEPKLSFLLTQALATLSLP
jgi:hypothetical protein